MKLNALIVLLFIFTLTTQTIQAQTGCGQKIEISDVKKANDNSSFDLKLTYAGSYTGKLVEMNDGNETVIQSFSGQGNLKKTFKNLKKSEYRIILDFKNETAFLCKQKMRIIDLTDTQ